MPLASSVPCNAAAAPSSLTPVATSCTSGPDERDVLLTLSNESDYAVVTALNDLQVVETDIVIKNGSNSDWTEGLLALRTLITPGLVPQSGNPEYYTTAFTLDGCDLKDAHCGNGCNDDGNATVLAKRLSKTKPGLGFVTVKSEMLNQRGEIVLELENTGMFLTREAAGL